MVIAQYIKEALIENGRVVVPGLGTFKTEYQPAYLKNNGSLILPPNAKVLFTDTIFSSDFDSLGDYMQSIQNRNRFDIEDDIQGFVKEIQSQLRQQERLVIQDFGTFIINKGGKLSFEAQEDTIFWADSFGLPKITAIPLVPITEDFDDEQKVVITPAPIKRDERKVLLWLMLIPMAVILFFGLYLLYDKDAYQKVSNMIQGDTQQIEPLSVSDDLPQLPEPVHLDELANSPTDTVVTSTKVNPITQEQPKSVEIPKITETKPKQMPSTSVVLPTKRYYIIVGSYSTTEKAKKAVSDYHKKGFSTAKVIETDKIRVSLADFNSKTEAEQNLPDYKKEVAGAWILNY